MTSLKLTFSDCYNEVGKYLGIKTLSVASDITNCKNIVYRGYRRFLMPIDSSTKKVHRWKFLEKTYLAGYTDRDGQPMSNISLYLSGTDPIVGINFEQMYPVTSLYFESTIQKMPFTSTGMMEIVDLVWAAAHCKNPQMCGFMISQHS